MKIKLVLFAACSLLAGSSRAQTSYPFLFSLYPTGLKRGTSAEISLNGLHNYHGAYKVLVQGKGLTGEVVVPKDGWPKPDAKGVVPTLNTITVKFTAAPDAGLGVHEVRVATPRGLSSVGLVVVGDDPEALEFEPNNTLDKAQAVPVGTMVNGRIQDGEDVDTYKFSAKEGEEITFSVLCARLQDKIHDLQTHADPILTLRDMTGRELAANDDYYRADPMLSYKFAKAGDYVIQIRDVGYQGNGYWVYRLAMTRRPYITAMVPQAIKPGQTLSAEATGFNLGGGTVEVQAGDMPPGEQCVAVKAPGGESYPVPILVTNLPVRKRASGLPAGQPDALSLGEVVSAKLTEKNVPHKYKLTLKKGQNISLEVDARKLDSQIDSVLRILNAQGGAYVENDDSAGPDSKIEWTAPADGDFFVEVSDLHRSAGHTFTYLLTAKEGAPDFVLRCDDDKMKLGPGGSGAWYVLVERKFGFNAPIAVTVKGLPAGVTAAPLIIPPNVNHGCLVLTAAPDAKMDASFVEVIGTAQAPDAAGAMREVSHTARPMSEIYLPGGGRAPYPVDTHAVCITEPSDILVEVSTTKVDLKPGGTAKIDVTIKRNNYTKPIGLDVILRHLGSIYGNPLPPGVTMDEGASKTLLGENETQGSIVLKADANAQTVTDLPIGILGQVSINFVVKVSYSSPPVRITVSK